MSRDVVARYGASVHRTALGVRLDADETRHILKKGGQVGKRLDFMMQELNREANTVLAKSTAISIKDAALAIKGEVEKLREQVQNVE